MTLTNSENTNEDSNSIVINLETLNLEYKNLLTKYQQAVLNYINYLQQQSESPCDSSKNSGDKNCWAIIKGQAFWGTSGISQTTTASAEECSATCSTTSGCTGATYNSDKSTCILRKGQGSPVAAEGSYAIVPKGKQLLQIIDIINLQLVNINSQILTLVEKGKEQYKLQSDNRQNLSSELLNNYYKLNEEKTQIAAMLNKYEDVDESLDKGNITVTQNYYSFLLLLALAVVIIFILTSLTITGGKSNQSGGNKLGYNVYYIVFFIAFITMIIHFYNKYQN